MLSFEGEQHQGMQAIMQKLTTLNFQTVQHIPKTVDCHPGINGAIVVFVTGNLAVRAAAAAARAPTARQGCAHAAAARALTRAPRARARGAPLASRRWTAT